MSRDYVGDTAETDPCCGRRRREPPEIDDATVRITEAVERLAVPRARKRRGRWRRCSTISMPAGRYALLKLAIGALRVGISARLAKQALAQAFGLEVEAVEEVWHGIRPPIAELFAWAEGRGPQPNARDVPVFRPFMLAHPLEETKVVARRLCGRVEMGRHPRPDRPCRRRRRGSTAEPATTLPAASPTLPRLFADPGRSRWRTASAGHVAGRRVMEARPPASTRSSSGSAARTSARRCSAHYPAFVRLYDICSTATRTSARWPGANGARAARRDSSPSSTPSGSICRS